MKKLNLFAIIVLAITASCTFNEENLSTDFTEPNSSIISKKWLDPNTPKFAKPYLKLNHNKKLNDTAKLNSPIYPNTEWEAVWSDEFNGTSLNTNKWIKSSENDRGLDGRTQNGITRWFWEQDNVNFNGTDLMLDVYKVGSGTLTGASIETRGKHEFKYGYYEVNVKIAETVKGTHTAFWLQGSNQGNIDDSGRDGAEIDVFESVYQPNEKVQIAVHYDGYGNDKGNMTIEYATPGIHNGNYHTFGMHWRKDFIDVYYDGSIVSSLNANKSFPISTALNGDPVVPEVPEWLWLSTGAAFKPTDFASQPSGFLTTALFDYVRVFKLKPLENTNFRIVNKETDSWIKTFGSDDDSYIKQTTNSYGDWTTWGVQKISGTDYYYIINEGTSKYIRPVSNTQNALVQLKPNTNTGSWTQWEFIDAGGDGYFYIKNKQTGKYLRPTTTGNSADLVIATKQETDWFKWRLE